MHISSYNNITDCRADCQKVIAIEPDSLFKSESFSFRNLLSLYSYSYSHTLVSLLITIFYIQELGGDLASIHSMAENDFLEDFVRSRPVMDSRGGER